MIYTRCRWAPLGAGRLFRQNSGQDDGMLESDKSCPDKSKAIQKMHRIATVDCAEDKRRPETVAGDDRILTAGVRGVSHQKAVPSRGNIRRAFPFHILFHSFGTCPHRGEHPHNGSFAEYRSPAHR